MADLTAATFSFLSWVRQGLAARTDTGLAVKDGHLALPVRLRLNDSDLADVPLQLYGPGDVVGLDAREIVRVEPPHLKADFEPNYLPLVEFDHPDFPWMFTPSVADANGRLQPWLCLVAVRKDSATLGVDTRRPLPVLECPVQELPDLAEAWAWAHAQVARSASLPDVKDALARQERTVSRLLCPRRLDSLTAYYACLVPTFEVGRLAGLGEPLTADDEKALRPAWTPAPPGGTPKTVRLPVYYQWEFSTGVGGDFESLARRLQPQPLPAEVGVKQIDVSRPGWGVGPFQASAAGAVVEFEGALRNPNVRAKPWPDDVRVPFETKLRQILDTSGKSATATGNAPVVGPPLYGQWYPQLESLPAAGAQPFWLSEVNLDPRYRVAAGLGALVVRYQQEELMAEAWDQLAAERADNERRKRAQLAEAVGQNLADKHLAPLSPQSLVQVTAPLRASATAPVATTTTKTSAPQSVLTKSAAPIAAPATRPATAPERSRDALLRGGASSAAFRRIARARGPIARRLAAVERRGAATAAATAATKAASQTVSPNNAAIRAAILGPEGAAAAPRWKVNAATFAGLASGETALRSQGTSLSKAAAPAPTVAQSSAQSSAAAVAAQGTDLVRFAPTFAKPMYEPLRDYFADMLLPGLEHVPADSVSLLETNPKFVEAYMLGLNHEMSRELTWRDYPADRRGTYFRQFWDASGRVPPPTPQERAQLADIAPVAEWRGDSHLGEHSSVATPAAQLVLVIRGGMVSRYPRAIIYALEARWSGGHRVPGTSELYPMFRVTRAPDIIMLGFTLTKQQARGADSAAGNPPGGAGWFFVLQEQPTEPRFGLDVATGATFGTKPARWSDLSWGHLASDADSLRQIVYVPLGGTQTSPPPALNSPAPGSATWGKNSAHMASILRQSPFRLVIHARTWLSA